MDHAAIIDAVLTVIIIIGIVAGYRRGFVRQVLGLLGLVAAFILALLFASSVALFLNKSVSVPYTPALIIGFVAVFIGAMVAVHFLALALQKVISMTLLGWVDKLTGALLGVIMGMVVASLIIAFMLAIPIPASLRRSFVNSNMSNFLQPVAPRIFNLLLDHGPKRINFERIFQENDSA